ncbi:MAG: GGDEF domain-containing protein [Bdellovibrionales bacterium]
MNAVSAPLDLLTDELADAPLTPEQRVIWRDLCAELVLARVRIQELETRLRVLDRDTAADSPALALLNRPDFNREVARMLAIDERYGSTSSVVYFNIENLEIIKDRHGTALVEAAIRCISDTLINQVRRSDVVGRLSPDEFGILLPRCDNTNAWKKAEKVATVLYDALGDLWGPNLKPQIGFGAYTFSGKDDLTQGLKQAAEGITKIVRG